MLAASRRIVGLALVLASAVVAVWSVAVDWYGGREGTSIGLQDLFSGLTPAASDTLGSLLIPLSLSALLVLVGIVAWWRWLWALGGLVAIATALLWAVRQAQTITGLHSGLVGAGPWMALSGGVGMWLAAAVVGPRPSRRRVEGEDRLSPDWTPAPGTRVGQSEGTAEPRYGEQPRESDDPPYPDERG